MKVLLKFKKRLNEWNLNNSTYIDTKGNVVKVFEADSSGTLVKYTPNSRNKSVIIPNYIKKIGYCVFENNQKIEKVVIPDSVTEIDDWAFHACKKLKSITIPNSVIKLGEGVFEYCISLKKIILPDLITKIESNAFNSCENLTEISIPKSIIEIKDYAFEGCLSLKDVYYKGTEQDWANIKINYTNNNWLSNIKIHFNS